MKQYRVRYLFFTIDEPGQVVYVIDVIHTARQTKLEEYRGG